MSLTRKAREAAQAMESSHANATPPAVTDTDAVEEAVARLVRFANGDGYDSVWRTGGEHSSARPDLRTVLSELDRLREQNDLLLTADRAVVEHIVAENRRLRSAPPLFREIDATRLQALRRQLALNREYSTIEGFLNDLASRIEQSLRGARQEGDR